MEIKKKSMLDYNVILLNETIIPDKNGRIYKLNKKYRSKDYELDE